VELPPRADSPSQRTILFTPASNVLFHVGRCVVLARELARRGHRVVMAGSPRYLRDPAVAADLEFEPLPDLSPEVGMELLRSILSRPDRGAIEAMIEAEISLLRRLRPDLVIADFRPTLRVSTAACGVPLASLLLGHWLPEYANAPDFVPRTYPVVVRARRLVGDRIALRFAPPAFRRVIRRKSAPLRAAARARGQELPPMLWDLLQGDLNLVTDAAELSPLPPGFHRVGPIVWEPETAAPDWLARLDRTRPVVFVNYGSTGHPDLFRLTFTELAERPWQVLLVTGGQIDPREFRLPGNFVVEKFLPGSKILEVADLVLYHGGAGTFHQALRAGTPGVVVATHWDQEYAGLVTERQGLGLFLTLRGVLARPGLLVRAIDQVLGNLSIHRERVEKLRRALRGPDGPAAAADRIEEFLSGASFPGTGGALASSPRSVASQGVAS
jgi:MGT family glycosyltransferase